MWLRLGCHWLSGERFPISQPSTTRKKDEEGMTTCRWPGLKDRLARS